MIFSAFVFDFIVFCVLVICLCFVVDWAIRWFVAIAVGFGHL